VVAVDLIQVEAVAVLLGVGLLQHLSALLVLVVETMLLVGILVTEM
jgi:hypothetical protein